MRLCVLDLPPGIGIQLGLGVTLGIPSECSRRVPRLIVRLGNQMALRSVVLGSRWTLLFLGGMPLV